MKLRLPVLLSIVALLMAIPPAFKKYQQISIGEEIRLRIASELIDPKRSALVLRDGRVKGIASYPYFSGFSLEENELRNYLESGEAKIGAEFWAVLHVHDLRPQIDIPVEERRIPRKKEIYLWPKGLCAGLPCRYDPAKLILVPEEGWKTFALTPIEISYSVKESGFTYQISLDVLLDRDGYAVSTTMRVLRNAINPFDRVFGELFNSRAPEFWYASKSSNIDLFTKKVTIFR